MYDAKVREIYATLFKTAEAALTEKLAREIADVVVKHPSIKTQISVGGK